jgi:hypothetical protein
MCQEKKQAFIFFFYFELIYSKTKIKSLKEQYQIA